MAFAGGCSVGCCSPAKTAVSTEIPDPSYSLAVLGEAAAASSGAQRAGID